MTHRDQAALGCYVTLDSVGTTAARTEVANAGKISVAGHRYPRMQLWSIADHFDDRRPELPLMTDPYTGQALQPGLM